MEEEKGEKRQPADELEQEIASEVESELISVLREMQEEITSLKSMHEESRTREDEIISELQKLSEAEEEEVKEEVKEEEPTDEAEATEDLSEAPEEEPKKELIDEILEAEPGFEKAYSKEGAKEKLNNLDEEERANLERLLEEDPKQAAKMLMAILAEKEEPQAEEIPMDFTQSQAPSEERKKELLSMFGGY